MKENVLSFSSEFLNNLHQENDMMKIFKLYELTINKNIYINNQKEFFRDEDIRRFLDSNNPNDRWKNSEQEIYPKTDEQNLRYYLFWHFADDNDKMQKYVTMAKTDVNNFLKFYKKFSQDSTIYFKEINDNENCINSWNADIIKYLFTSKHIIIYDAYCLNKPENIKNNIIPFLENINCNQSGSEKIVIIFTSNKKNFNERLGIDYFKQKYENIRQGIIGIKLIIFIKDRDHIFNNRFILTDYFFITAIHSLQAINKYGLQNNYDSLNFQPLLNNSYKEVYYSFIKELKELIKNFKDDSSINRIEGETYINLPYKDEILGINDFQNKEEIFNILDSF